MYLRLMLLLLAAALVAFALVSCSQETPSSWPVGHPPQRPEGVLPGTPNWYPRL